MADANLHANIVIKAPEASKACMQDIAMCLMLQFMMYKFRYGMADAPLTRGHMKADQVRLLDEASHAFSM